MLNFKKEKPLQKKELPSNKEKSHKTRVIVLQPGQRITIVCKKKDDLDEF